MALPTPIAYWPFNEASGTTAADASGNGHTATIVHGTWDTTVLRTFGAAALKNTDGGAGASFTAINLGTVYSIAFWMNGWDGSNDGLSLGGMSASGYATYHNSTSILHQVGAGNSVTNPATGLTGAHHIALTRNGTTVTFYKDGVSIGSQTLTSNTALSLDTVSGYASGTFALNATLDDVRIYGVVLSPAEVAELYAFNPDPPAATARVTQYGMEVLSSSAVLGLVTQCGVEVLGATMAPPPLSPYQTRILADGAIAYWPLDDAVGSPTVRDIAPGNRTGTLTGTTTLGVPGVAFTQTALDLDGTTGAVLAPALPAINPLFSVEAWVFLRSMPDFDYATILDRQQPTATGWFSLEFVRVSTPPKISFRTATAGNMTAALLLTLNAWHHVVLTSDGTVMKSYLDAQFDTQLAGANVAENPGSLPTTALGAHRDGTKFWNGRLQDVAVYARALTPTEITQHFVARTAPDAPPVPPVKGHHGRGKPDKNGGLVVVSTTAAAPFGPRLAFANLPVQVDANGALKVATTALTAPLSAPIALANARTRLDANGALLVTTTTVGTLTPRVLLGNARVRVDANGALLVSTGTAATPLDPTTAIDNIRGRADVNGALSVVS